MQKINKQNKANIQIEINFFCVSCKKNQIVNEYTDWERTSQHPINTRDAAVAALSDAQFVAPLVHTGDTLAPPAFQPGQEKAGPKCFFYVFDYQTKDGDYPQVCTAIQCQFNLNGESYFRLLIQSFSICFQLTHSVWAQCMAKTCRMCLVRLLLRVLAIFHVITQNLKWRYRKR